MMIAKKRQSGGIPIMPGHPAGEIKKEK